MATLAEAVDAAETDWLVSADIPDTVDYFTVESEVVQVTATFPAQYQARDGSTSDPRIRVVRAAGGTTGASHADGTTLTPLIPPSAGSGGGPTPTLAEVLAAGNDAESAEISNVGGPFGPADAATKDYVDTAISAIPPTTPPLAAVLLGNGVSIGTADGNDTGGVPIVHEPAVDEFADVGLNAVATGTGNANTRPLAQTEDGNAVAGPRAEATGDGNTDACTYARSVDGDALADNDAASTGSGAVDAGCFAIGVDGALINAGAMATATGTGNARVAGIATVNTGIATAGSTATSPMGTAGMEALADGTSARTGFFGTTPIARPEIPATPTEQDIADVLVALGLVTQAA